MAVDYVHNPAFSIGSTLTGPTLIISNIIDQSKHVDPSTNTLYQMVASSVLQEIELETATLKYSTSADSLSIVSNTVFPIDFANKYIFLADTITSPGRTIYKCSIDPLNVTPVASYSTGRNGNYYPQAGTFSPISNTLLMGFNAANGRLLLDASDMTLITAINSSNAVAAIHLPSEDFFIHGVNSGGTGRYILMDAATGTIVIDDSLTGSTLTNASINTARQKIWVDSVGKLFIAGVDSSDNMKLDIVTVGSSALSLDQEIDFGIAESVQVIHYVDSINSVVIQYLTNNYIFVDLETYAFSFSLGLHPSTNFRSTVAGTDLLVAVTLNTSYRYLDFGRIRFVPSSTTTIICPNKLSDSLVSDSVYFPLDNTARISDPLAFFVLDAFLYAANSSQSQIEYSYTRSGNTTSIIGSTLEFADDGEIEGQYILTIGAGGSLDLSASTRTTFTENITLDATSTVIVGASVNLEAFTFAAGTTVNADDASGPYTVTVSNDPGIVAGTGITIAAPVSEIVLTGIPNVAGAITGAINLSTMEQTFPTISAGSATIPTDPAANYLIAVDAPGYQLQRVVLSGATPSFEVELENNRDLYEAGVDISENLLFNYTTFEVTFVWAAGVEFSNANIYRTVEDYLATPQGVFFPNPPRPIRVPGRNFLFFPYDQDADQVNPVRVRPHPDNLGNPRITDVVVILEGAENPQTDIFDFSLAGGKTIFYQTDATVATVSVSGGLSSEDRAVLATITNQTAPIADLAETLEAPGVFSAEALANVPSTGGAGLGPDELARLERIENQLIADVRKGASRFQRLLPGTETVILDKDVAFDLTEGYVLTEHT